MTESYTTGGDSFALARDKYLAGQTFRPTHDHILRWIDLNIKPVYSFPQPRIHIYYAGSDHRPYGDPISSSPFPLRKQSFTPRDWTWYEPWGLTLTENHGWWAGPPFQKPEITLKNSAITLVNPGYTTSHIDVPISPRTIMLLDTDGKHLFLHHHSPVATGHPEHHWAAYALITDKSGDSWYLEAVISHGTDWPPFGGLCGLTPLGSSYFEGRGPKITDFTQQWIDCRTQHGLDADPTGWFINAIMLLVEDTQSTPGTTLTNNYLGLAHEKFEPAPLEYYPVKRPWLLTPWTLGRARFPMIPVLLIKDTYYCMVLDVPKSILPSGTNWQYDKADATYPRGIRVESHDGGDSWARFYNDDHLFAEFGSPPAPSPPPELPITNVAPVDFKWTPTTEGLRIQIATSTPCHLIKYETEKPPDKHLEPILRRGLPFSDQLRYCFVNWLKGEQIEPGDTIYHTFIQEPWPGCTTRYIVFLPLINFELSPSISPIFTIHNPIVDITPLIIEEWTWWETFPPDYQLLLLEPWTS